MAIAEYLKLVEAASGGQITTKLFASGQLYADKDVIKALVQQEVEMAAPGTWLISAYVPDADMLQLPAFWSAAGSHPPRCRRSRGRQGQ